jgi:uncharacterized protein (DUF58 family)
VRGPVSAEDLARATRLLVVRSRHEAAGLFAGNYASAFRGGGLEFEESRPYAPGDDVTALDASATARTGELYVKRFREERNQTILFALDGSGSMGFGSRDRTKAETAAHALALVVAAAGRAGDRTGLLAFDTSVREEIAPGRGGAHGLRVIRSATAHALRPGGETRLGSALRALRATTRRRSIVLLLSDFRDAALFPPEPEPARLRAELAELSRRHDVIAAPIIDPLEEDLPPVGPVRIRDPERPGPTRLLHTGRRGVRRRYRTAALRWRARLEGELRRSGAEVLWLRTDRDPIHALGIFFHERAARRARR